MHYQRRQFLILGAGAALLPSFTRIARPADVIFPGATWEKAAPADVGWSIDKLEMARQFFQSLPPASMVVVHRGRVIVEWGDPAKRIKVSSVRKSLLSALYGRYVRNGSISLDNTLEQLSIDDDPPLTQQEKRTTLRALLQARSGVYHSFVGGTPGMLATMPARGSHPSGTFWYYNNWDFNALGTIFEQQTHKRIVDAFRDEIAVPIGMQDFQLEDMYYDRSTESVHPTYAFRLSVRDMARFGYLFLRNGNWKDRQIVPQDWVRESTRSYSDVGDFYAFQGDVAGDLHRGYGYLWWVNQFALPMESFSAAGALGKYIVVIPEKETVVAFANHTEYPDSDKQRAMSDAELRSLPNVSFSQMGKLLNFFIEAQSG